MYIVVTVTSLYVCVQYHITSQALQSKHSNVIFHAFVSKIFWRLVSLCAPAEHLHLGIYIHTVICF